MQASPQPVGTVDVAIAHASRLLDSDPSLAAEQAAEILKVVPAHGPATMLLGLAFRRSGRKQDATSALQRAVSLDPNMPDAWRSLGDQLFENGDVDGADAAYARFIKCSTRDPRLLAPASALCENRLATAESLLREHLKAFPTDVAAIRMLAEVGCRLGRYSDAEKLLTRCLELAPSFSAARHNYAIVLHRQNKWLEALRQVELLLSVDGGNPGYLNLQAAIYARIGESELSIEAYGHALADYPRQPKVWMSYGHALKTAGRREEAVQAYRQSIALSPKLGEAYWSLANLKKVRFTAADIDAMRAQLERDDISLQDRFHFHFALGKAFEDSGRHAESFEHYSHGNELRRKAAPYDATEVTSQIERSKALFTREFFEDRAGVGQPADDPIFIVGLPRAGSTLLEQILSSHSAVEGTQELPDIIALARRLGGPRSRTEPHRYPEVLLELSAEQIRQVGQEYLERVRIHRKAGRPRFIDKMPNNFMHVGLIHLALPNARIIDARRHPLGCCFSNFKQHFARGQLFSYRLEDLGTYYRDYVDLMDHFERVLPGRVHRVIYESLVEDTESEVRRLLEYCGLPYEAGCLEFHRNERAVRTASSEQVRVPIYREGLAQWRNFESWLDPLKRALGPALDGWHGAV
jgi:tetratricopeptide (TPR) repeat protein